MLPLLAQHDDCCNSFGYDSLQFDASTPARPFYINTLTQQSQWAFPDAPARCSISSSPHTRPSHSPPPHTQSHSLFPSAPPLDDSVLPSPPHPPDELTDQCFSCTLFTDPVVADDGFTYERSSIEAYWARCVFCLSRCFYFLEYSVAIGVHLFPSFSFVPFIRPGIPSLVLKRTPAFQVRAIHLLLCHACFVMKRAFSTKTHPKSRQKNPSQ